MQQSRINPDAPVKEYTGVWIPADVMECDELSPNEKILYGEIAGFRECYASNAWLANRIGRSERTIKRLISHLIELGFVENCGFNGRFRLIRVCQNCHSRGVKNDTSDVTKMSPINKSIDKSINNKLLKKESVENYGNPQINKLMKVWKDETGITPSSNPANRNACSTLLRQKGAEGAKHIVQLIGKAIRSGDKYAPSIASFRDLYGQYGKLEKLEAWERRQTAQNAKLEAQKPKIRDMSAYYDGVSDKERAKVSEAFKKARKQLFEHDS